MRIKENICDDIAAYSFALQNRVEKVFQYTLKITEIKNLLANIKKEAANLRELLWTKEELKQREEAVSFFQARMQATVYYTLKNLENYQQCGWKNLFKQGEDCDE
ncbi:MAG: hypothetical protein JM58_17800 [Peptococcaceae bacterium BICA1-8]|nr:MAG: hypothetical protein VR72_07350 [Clostridiaceae bacterium BRH_c20a]KJS81116.1 MAG: hypothetical protein JM58_17800 [Peptococcaceae bacterium BICA1-8]